MVLSIIISLSKSLLGKGNELMTKEPSSIAVGLIQMSCSSHPDENVEKAVDLIREAARQGAQVVCLPELFRTQYFCQKEDARLFNLAESIPGPTTSILEATARESRIVLVASLFERTRRRGLSQYRRGPRR